MGGVDPATPVGLVVLTVMAVLAQVEREIKQERITASVGKRRVAGKDLGGRGPAYPWRPRPPRPPVD